MAYYKNGAFLVQQQGPEFDALHAVSQATPFSGIYRCTVCGQSITSTFSHPLPPQNHHQHPQHQPIRWQLIVKSHYK
ncbi:hypothetical protein G6L94_16605 [Agrobacterium rhizogenes]|uniref:hypothetical protein n=1 Tax=Rhizobium rhizogenes TaxID=359 RepID=UPI00080FB746|nr:hypothetical protein [Rhizobium rhizogenes]OCJ22113.1 hypothetical protein A6U89_33205 [Agrobacterium sp. B133/95]NTH13566.1 hypothetical protein [Rhizobium rhizogenes]NTI49943.1 hypothetical protein [Rhizobium rhizogenes]NTI95314.1 hypothetical protein [Rhizobium rhizogenes]NTJ57782.1 hypothetical protein [Rhizobium rhizogenes]